MQPSAIKQSPENPSPHNPAKVTGTAGALTPQSAENERKKARQGPVSVSKLGTCFDTVMAIGIVSNLVVEKLDLN